MAPISFIWFFALVPFFCREGLETFSVIIVNLFTKMRVWYPESIPTRIFKYSIRILFVCVCVVVNLLNNNNNNLLCSVFSTRLYLFAICRPSVRECDL